MKEHVIPMTDDRGQPVMGRVGLREPLPGSVVLAQGPHGTAYQRFFSDGLWHRVGGGRAKAWVQMLDLRNLVLVYDAPERVTPDLVEWVQCSNDTCAFRGQGSHAHPHKHVRSYANEALRKEGA